MYLVSTCVSTSTASVVIALAHNTIIKLAHNNIGVQVQLRLRQLKSETHVETSHINKFQIERTNEKEKNEENQSERMNE